MGLIQTWYRAPGGESQSRRVLLVTLALIYSISSSGIVFGYSALYDVLLFDVKAFSEFCKDGESPCPAQRDGLSRMFTIAATTISGCSFIVGLFLDFAGPRVTVCLGSLLLAGGLLAVAFAQEVSSNFYYLGFFLMAVGGPCIFDSTYSFGELFPNKSAGIIGALSTGFNSSTIVFCTFGAIIQFFHVSLKSVFIAYTALPAIIFISSVLLFPDKPFESVGKDEGEHTRFNGELHRIWTITMTQGKYPADMEGPDGQIAGADFSHLSLDEAGLKAPLLVNGALTGEMPPELSYTDADTVTPRKKLFRRRSFRFDDGPPQIYNTPFSKQINSSVYWSMALVTSYVTLRLIYYIQTLYEQLIYTARLQFAGNDAAARAAASYYTKVFNYLLPPGGLAMIPVVGFLLVEWGFAPSFLVIAILHMLFCLVNAFSWPPIQFQVLAFALYAMIRPILFGSMAAYIGRLFGFKNFGKLYGLMRVMGSLAVSLEYPLQLLTIHTFQGQYIYVNVAFVLIGLLLFIYPVFLWKKVFYGNFIRPPLVKLQTVEEDTS